MGPADYIICIHIHIYIYRHTPMRWSSSWEIDSRSIQCSTFGELEFRFILFAYHAYSPICVHIRAYTCICVHIQVSSDVIFPPFPNRGVPLLRRGGVLGALGVLPPRAGGAGIHLRSPAVRSVPVLCEVGLVAFWWMDDMIDAAIKSYIQLVCLFVCLSV